MDIHILSRFMWTLALQARCLGMQAENQARAFHGESPAYNDEDFGNIANQLESMARDL